MDYYTIESLFQYSFNEPKSEEFPYLDNCWPKVQRNINIKRKTDYQVLDVVVIGKKKPKVFSKEYLANLLQRFFQQETELYLKDFVEKLRTIIYNDTKDELQDEISFKDEEILKLRKEIENVNKMEAEINKLMNENKMIKNNKNESEFHYQESTTNKNIVEEPILYSNDSDKKQIIKEVLLYKKKKTTTLEKEAKERGIIVPNDAKPDDIIVLLMTAPKDIPASEIQFTK